MPKSAAEVVLPSPDLDASIAFFRDQLGFRLDMIFPADAPRVALLSGHGLTVRLDTAHTDAPATLCLRTDDAALLAAEQPLTAPGGVGVITRPLAEESLDVTLEPTTHIEPPAEDGAWGVGRAGMQYRDLLPGRLGGAWMASHIRIPNGGPVPDYVHHHHVRFQIIYCRRGWVRVVYEDQGEPFVMHEGDCVLQPPHIRHRVLECSDGFEVVEVGSPAEHQTLVDHDMILPNDRIDPERLFSGQRFVRHVAADTSWQASEYAGLEVRPTGIATATDGIGDVRVLRPDGSASVVEMAADNPFLLRFVLDGSLTLDLDGETRLGAGAAFVVPADRAHRIGDFSDDCRILEVTGC